MVINGCTLPLLPLVNTYYLCLGQAAFRAGVKRLEVETRDGFQSLNIHKSLALWSREMSLNATVMDVH